MCYKLLHCFVWLSYGRHSDDGDSHNVGRVAVYKQTTDVSGRRTTGPAVVSSYVSSLKPA
jgi:hypothetical protein